MPDQRSGTAPCCTPGQPWDSIQTEDQRMVTQLMVAPKFYATTDADSEGNIRADATIVDFDTRAEAVEYLTFGYDAMLVMEDSWELRIEKGRFADGIAAPPHEVLVAVTVK